MIVSPKIRGFLCTTAHPSGCARSVAEQIAYVRSSKRGEAGPKKALIIGASTGYGLASRIAAAFGGGRAATVGVFYESESDGRRTATAGYYNSVAFEEEARREGLYAASINGDAFSNEIKSKTIDLIKRDLGSVDLVVYSVAAPRRTCPETGKIFKSVLKPIGGSYTNRSLNTSSMTLETVTLQEATQEEIEQTVAVMGGDDWTLWIAALKAANVLSPGAVTVAYSYVGPEVTQPIYRNGTIGRAKEHLERTAHLLDEELKSIGGRAAVVVNKAVVTQSSSAIPFIPLYYVILSKVMKEQGVDEDCIQQIQRLYVDFLYGERNGEVDENGLIRLDTFELSESVQRVVSERWRSIEQDNLAAFADLEGYRKEFLRLFGFGLDGVNYDEDVAIDTVLPSHAGSEVVVIGEKTC